MAYNDSRLSLEAATERTDTIFIRQPRAWPTFESEEQTSPPTFPDRSPALGESSLSPTSTLADGKDSSRFYPGFTRLDEQMDEALLGNHVKSKYYATYANPDIFFSATVKGHGVADLGIQPVIISKKSTHPKRTYSFSVAAVCLALYSTIISLLWLILALRRQRYGSLLSVNGSMTPGTASTLFAAFAKSIELSFATVFITFLGQLLSRRALFKKSEGISIAEMSYKHWLVQPGTIFSHWANLHYVFGSFLGFTTVIAAVTAIFYTTASDALVSPTVEKGRMEQRSIWGRVDTTFANSTYIGGRCQTPVPASMDNSAGSTCVQMEHSGQANLNFIQYLDTWIKGISERSSPIAGLNGNTSVVGSWVRTQNMTELSARYGRVVNNISMAMPHAGIIAAAQEPINAILQPQDIEGSGSYKIEASVLAPVINVLCVNASGEDITPFLYRRGNATVDAWLTPSGYLKKLAIREPDYPTPLDALFGFSAFNRSYPIFPKRPIPYNTVLGRTAPGADAIYLLTASPTSDYMMCSISAFFTINCSTLYWATLGGGQLMTKCVDADELQDVADPGLGDSARNKDWVDVAMEWASSVALNSGLSDSNDSNSRVLAQLIPTSYALDSSLPSIAEALAVYSSCTILLSSLNAPFITLPNHSSPVPNTTLGLQRFPALLQTEEYASGGAGDKIESVFFFMLFIVPAINTFCLAYFIYHGRFIADFIAPANLFALALNSPPREIIVGSSGLGLEGKQLKSKWAIDEEGGRFYIRSSRRGAGGGSGGGEEMRTVEVGGGKGEWGSPKEELESAHHTVAKGDGLLSGVDRSW